MKIVDMRCAVVGKNAPGRTVSDEGTSGYGQVAPYEPYADARLAVDRPVSLGLDQDRLHLFAASDGRALPRAA